MNIQSLATANVLILASVLTFGLGIWVYFEKRRDPRNVTFGALLIAAAIWGFSFVFWLVAADPAQGSFWLRSLFFIGSLLPTLAFMSAEAVFEGVMPSSKLQAGIFVPNAALFWIAYATPLLIAPPGTAVLAPGRGIFALHFLAATLLAVVMVIKHRREGGAAARGTRAVMVGTTVYFASVAAVLFLSDLSKGSASLTAAAALIIVSMFAVAATLIHRRFSVDLRLVGLELFLLLALLVIIMNIVVSESVLDFTVRLVILIVLAFYGALTTKTMVQEVRRLKEIEALQEQAMAMNGRLIEADKMKTRFVSFASHQLRAPIGGVRSYLDMLLAGEFGELNGEQKAAVGEVHGAMTRMAETVETFLSVAKIQEGQLQLYRSETDLAVLAEKVIAEMGPIAEKKGLALTLEAAPALPQVLCDPGKVYHVLLNLVDNAVKYTEKGKIAVKIVREKDSVAVRVKDSGAGMSSSDVRSLFKQYARGAEGIKLDPSGSGLGLFLARKIVEAHGGEMLVSSPGKGKGSTFGFRLPMAPDGA